LVVALVDLETGEGGQGEINLPVDISLLSRGTVMREYVMPAYSAAWMALNEKKSHAADVSSNGHGRS
jgi:hypothetical protein